MRPVPSPKHMPSIVILIAASLLAGYLAWHDDSITDDQVHILTALRANGSNYAGDSLYDGHIAGGEFRHMYSPAFTSLIEGVRKICPAGSAPEMPLRLLVAPVAMLFLLGMYALLWRQTMSSATSTFVAILSATMMSTFNGWHWGVGAISSITPEGLVVAVSPLLVLAYLKYFNDRRIMLVFLVMGLCANVDFVSAMNLAIISLMVLLACHRCNRQALAVCVCSIFLFIVGALPGISHMLAVHAQVLKAFPNAAAPDFATIMQAFSLSYYEVTYPGLLVPLWQWGLYPLTLAAVSLVVLWRLDKFRSQFVDLWVWMAISALIVMLAFHAMAMGAAGFVRSTIPFYVFLQASSWLMLPLYVLFARALTQVFRILEKKHRHLLRWAMAGVMIGWMLPTDAFRPMRYGLYSLTALTPIGQNSLKINDILERKARRRELANIAKWQNGHCTNSFVYVDDPKYRLNSGQAILNCPEDFICYYQLAPSQISRWMDDLHDDRKTMVRPLNIPELTRNATARAAATPQITEFFVITSDKDISANPQNLQEVKSDDNWGKYWKIFRIPLK